MSERLKIIWRFVEGEMKKSLWGERASCLCRCENAQKVKHTNQNVRFIVL